MAYWVVGISSDDIGGELESLSRALNVINAAPHHRRELYALLVRLRPLLSVPTPTHHAMSLSKLFIMDTCQNLVHSCIFSCTCTTLSLRTFVLWRSKFPLHCC